jgi:hypothetical protein
MLDRPSPFTSHAKPMRGAKLFQSFFHSVPVGPSLEGFAAPVRTASMIWEGVAVVMSRPGLP